MANSTHNLYFVTNNSKLATLTISDNSVYADMLVFINTDITEIDDNFSTFFLIAGSSKTILLHKGDQVILRTTSTSMTIESSSGIPNLQRYDGRTYIFNISESEATVITHSFAPGTND